MSATPTRVLLCDLVRDDAHRRVTASGLISRLGEQCAVCDRYVWQVAVAFRAAVPIVARRRNDARGEAA